MSVLLKEMDKRLATQPAKGHRRCWVIALAVFVVLVLGISGMAAYQAQTTAAAHAQATATSQALEEDQATRTAQAQAALAAQIHATATEQAARVLLRALSGHTDMVYSVAFSPDGKMLASGSYDHTIKLWRVP